MSRSAWVVRRLRHHRFGFTGLFLCLIVGIVLVVQDRNADLPPAEIDRLRLRAGAGQDRLALKRLQQAAQHGSLAAQRASASVLLAGPDKVSVAQGLEFARTAAERGDSAAQYLLAKTLFDGTPVQRADRRQARLWFQKAAAQNHPQAAYFLGLIYKNGYGIALDHAAAAGWFARAAALGNPDAMFMLGNAYLDGDGVAQDQARARRLFQQAAELEHPLAAQMLGYALRDGALGLQPDARQSEQMMVEVEHALHHPRAVF